MKLNAFLLQNIFRLRKQLEFKQYQNFEVRKKNFRKTGFNMKNNLGMHFSKEEKEE